MNSNREKHHRNVTPNFLRFKRTSSGKKNEVNLENKQSLKSTGDRSTSRNSHCSIEVYEKRVLHLSKLKNTLRMTDKNKDRQVEAVETKRKPKEKLEVTCYRKSSGGKHNDSVTTTTQSNRSSLKKRPISSSGSNKNINVISREKSHKKSADESLEKEEQRAKLINADLMNQMMSHRNAPNYVNKLKLKRFENDKKKKKKFLNLIIDIKGEENLRNYEVFGELGKGAFGTVRMGIEKRTGKKVAIKVYDKKCIDEPNKIKNLEREINILSQLDYPVIAKLIEAIESAEQIFIILEYGGANSLYNYLLSKPQHRLQQWEAKLFFKKIAETLAYLHQRNIVHRDIKAENILLNRDKQLKLIDFGFSIETKPPSKIDTFCGTPTYMAPEIVSKKDHVAVYTDMWSMGILLYVLLQGNYPFRAKSESELFQKIRKGKFEYIHNNISKEARDVIESLLKVEPLQRATVKDLLQPDMVRWLEGKDQ